MAFLTTAADLAGPDDARLTTVRGRLGLALAWALHFDEAVKVARDAAERIAQGEGAHAAASYLAEVTAALGAAGSSAHAWQLAPAGLAYAGSSRDESWAALTLLALDRKEAADPDHVGLPLDESRRRQALAVLYRSPQPVTRSVDLARYAVAAIYQRRDSVPAEAAQDPTVLLYLLGALRPALPVVRGSGGSGPGPRRTGAGGPLPGEYCPLARRPGRPPGPHGQPWPRHAS